MLFVYLSPLESDADNDLLTWVYTTYKKTMYAVAFHILKDASRTEDTVHDSFIKVIQHFKTCKNMPEEELPAWLSIIVKHTALDILRKEKRVTFLEDEGNLPDDSCANQPQEKAFFHALLAQIKKMPELYRTIFELKYVGEWSDQEIAKELHLNANTLRSRLARGKAILKAVIEKEEADSQ